MNMLNQKNLLVTMFVMGEYYQQYIPIFLYCALSSYPEYDYLILVKGSLSEELKTLNREVLKVIGCPKDKVTIKEGVFADYPVDSNVIKTLRWVYSPEIFLQYKCVYIGDIDILFTPEKEDIFTQHMRVCKRYKTSYSNTDKIDPPDTRGHRMTGLHFFMVEPYLRLMLPVMTKYSEILKDGMPPEFNNEVWKRPDNQHALWVLISLAGLQYPQHSFFRYHGLHLGHSRIKGRWEVLCKDPEHKIYIDSFKQHFVNDSVFWDVFYKLDKRVQVELIEIFKACNCKTELKGVRVHPCCMKEEQ